MLKKRNQMETTIFSFKLFWYSSCKLTTKISSELYLILSPVYFNAKISQSTVVAHYFPNRFMDEIQEKMVGMEEEASVVKDLYDLMEKYQVPVSPEDHAVYQVGGGVH